MTQTILVYAVKSHLVSKRERIPPCLSKNSLFGANKLNNRLILNMALKNKKVKHM